ncbi:MAG: hypothetical protein KH028_06870 [Oscillospiraceae bacterium]|jgi:hypothetical protein|nr:hypothetical protein [Oscillospiraceae bacterium]
MFHRKLLRRLLALVCTLALCLGLSGPVSAAGDVYFSVVNDSMITLSDNTMPVWSGGVLYVPHSVFDGTNSTGIGFGLNFSYNRDTGIASLFTTQQILTFDLNRGISYDYISGTPLKGRAILRNGRPYLPVGQVCSFFGLSYSVIAIPEGHIVRVKNGSVSLSDAAFVDAASNLISRYLREYNQAQQSPPTPGVRPPTVSGTEAPLQEEPETTDNPQVYLGFRCDDTQGLSQVLDALDARNKVGIFFFPPDALEREDDLLYRILGSGHSVGLLAEGETTAATSRLLERGSRTLERIGYIRTTLALVPNSQRNALQDEGWICWNETVNAVPTGRQVSASSHANAVIRKISSRLNSAYLTLDAGANSARVLPTLLQRLGSRSYPVSVPLETRL